MVVRAHNLIRNSVLSSRSPISLNANQRNCWRKTTLNNHNSSSSSTNINNNKTKNKAITHHIKYTKIQIEWFKSFIYRLSERRTEKNKEKRLSKNKKKFKSKPKNRILCTEKQKKWRTYSHIYFTSYCMLCYKRKNYIKWHWGERNKEHINE